MHVDARQLPPGAEIFADLCIIGGGAAGITIACQLAHTPIAVCLLEAGGLDPDSGADAGYEVITVGRPYGTLSRLRCLGGNTNIWGGHCVPMRAINFERLPWSPYSGWPFGPETLLPYYQRAHDYLELGPLDYDAVKTAAALGAKIFPFDPLRVETVMSRYRAIRFGATHGNALIDAKNVTLYTYANVISLNRAPEVDYVESVSIKTPAEVTATVHARQYVLAAGGIENPRILLASSRVQREGLGNQNGLVGRFFTEHIWYPSGTIIPATVGEPLVAYGGELPLEPGVTFRFHVSIPEPVVRDYAIPDFRAEIDVLRPCSPRGEATVYRLNNYTEQAPNPDSRIMLSSEKDRLGTPKALIDWRLSERDKEGIRTAQELIAAEAQRSGFGRMEIELDPAEAELLAGADGGCHHMGTTRMHDDPRQGVVDRNCRVHGLHNLHVAGSSVFPTAGYANPTLTIVALAIRLADHLRRMS